MCISSKTSQQQLRRIAQGSLKFWNLKSIHSQGSNQFSSLVPTAATSTCRTHEVFSPGEVWFGQNLGQTSSKVTQRQDLPPQAWEGFYRSLKSLSSPSFLNFWVLLSRLTQLQVLSKGADIPEKSRTKNSILKCDPSSYYLADGIFQVQS